MDKQLRKIADAHARLELQLMQVSGAALRGHGFTV